MEIINKKSGILIVLLVSILFIASVSSLTWIRPKSPTIETNFTNVTDLIYFVNQTLYNEITNINNSLFYMILGVNSTLNNQISNVNITLNNQISNVNLSLYNYINQINQTLSNQSEIRVYRDYAYITTSSGKGGTITGVIDFLITRISVYPSSNSTKYRFKAIEQTSGDVIDQDRALHTGVWDIYKTHSINDNIVYNITSANPDDTFTIKLTYSDNFQ